LNCSRFSRWNYFVFLCLLLLMFFLCSFHFFLLISLFLYHFHKFQLFFGVIHSLCWLFIFLFEVRLWFRWLFF
jgi:hypothetical protein